MKQLRVDLKDNGYDIIIKKGIINNIADFLQTSAEKIFIITDNNVAELYLDALEKSLKQANFDVCSMVLPAGEKTKSFDSLIKIYEKMVDFNMTRTDMVITFGGGVIGDLGGFASATYHRGIDYVQIPTTLLSQVDSSVGGKVGVDLPEGKNLAGSFYQPKRVIIDPSLLETLSDYYFTDGMGEVIKYGCIRDAELFDLICECGNRQNIMAHIEDVIFKCCQIKVAIVQADERDLGERMLLNFGHTYGHALEKFYNYEKIGHGQAVGVGMYYVTCISEKLGQTYAGTSEKIKNALKMFGLPWNDNANSKKVIMAVAKDKKNLGKRFMAVVLTQIGSAYLYPTTIEYFEKGIKKKD